LTGGEARTGKPMKVGRSRHSDGEGAVTAHGAAPNHW